MKMKTTALIRYCKDQVVSYCIDFLRNRHLYFS